MKPTLAITVGDFNGIGPELALKISVHPLVKRICQPLLIGPIAIFEEVVRRSKLHVKLEKTTLHLTRSSYTPVLDVGDGIGPDITYGTPSKSSGSSAGAALERAVELCLQGKVAAMVTAPVSKEALNLAGYNFPGQTEMIALLSHSQQAAMMLLSDKIKIGLVTIHTSVKDIASQVSKDKVLNKIEIVYESLKNDFKIKNPKIAVLALNPHAGEHGIIGNEDDEIISPSIQEAKSKKIQAEGPFPADAFFGVGKYKHYDATIAMYHDQGLIPLKMLAFDKGVNFTAGLKIIRTSPDHGTAYDIAGKNKADMNSMLEAVKLAVLISKNRKKV